MDCYQRRRGRIRRALLRTEEGMLKFDMSITSHALGVIKWPYTETIYSKRSSGVSERRTQYIQKAHTHEPSHITTDLLRANSLYSDAP